jgi:hypothetical protein
VIGGGNDIPLVSPKTPPKVQISFHGKSSPGCERLRAAATLPHRAANLYNFFGRDKANRDDLPTMDGLG